MASQDLIPHLQLADTFGALFIGAILAAILFGVTNVQVFIYFQTHIGTGITFYKLVVIWLWTLDALHLAMIVHCIYFYLVTNYGNVIAFTVIVWSFKAQLVIAVVTIYVEHLLYVHRIWTISKGRSKFLPITVGIAVVLASGVAIVILWCIFQKINVFTDFLNYEWALYAYLGSVAFVDILIASSLCYLLTMSRTGFSRRVIGLLHIKNDGLYHQYRLFDERVFNGSYHFTMPNNYISEAVQFLLLKLYVNSFIALMNTRYYAQPNADAMHSSEYHVRHDVYRPKLHIGASQDEDLKASQKSMYSHPDEVSHIARPGQAVVLQRSNEMITELDSLSSA
ncbi:hypothetical protein C8R48DRAFT_775453 [Suillus tomentosus]|nr:hypothetical protein C8R48DRAFT_775453 [Suillus tomentosus]